MYESPITMIMADIESVMEGEIFKAVQRYGIDVDKEELIKALQYDRDQYNKGYQDGLNADKWIPCSERLPEKDEKAEYYASVIVTLDNGRVAEGCYINHDKEWWVDAPDGEHFSEDMTGHVIAWQPLPEPYKEKTNG